LPLVIILSSCTNNNSDKKGEIVYVENKARQCEYNGLTVDETAGILTKAKMLVIDSDCGYIKGVASASVRGGVTAEINRHTVRVQDLADAKKLGYKSISALTDSCGNKSIAHRLLIAKLIAIIWISAYCRRARVDHLNFKYMCLPECQSA
jgi:hypothetical protein